MAGWKESSKNFCPDLIQDCQCSKLSAFTPEDVALSRQTRINSRTPPSMHAHPRSGPCCIQRLLRITTAIYREA